MEIHVNVFTRAWTTNGGRRAWTTDGGWRSGVVLSFVPKRMTCDVFGYLWSLNILIDEGSLLSKLLLVSHRSYCLVWRAYFCLPLSCGSKYRETPGWTQLKLPGQAPSSRCGQLLHTYLTKKLFMRNSFGFVHLCSLELIIQVQVWAWWRENTEMKY